MGFLEWLTCRNLYLSCGVGHIFFRVEALQPFVDVGIREGIDGSCRKYILTYCDYDMNSSYPGQFSVLVLGPSRKMAFEPTAKDTDFSPPLGEFDGSWIPHTRIHGTERDVTKGIRYHSSVGEGEI